MRARTSQSTLKPCDGDSGELRAQPVNGSFQ